MVRTSISCDITNYNPCNCGEMSHLLVGPQPVGEESACRCEELCFYACRGYLCKFPSLAARKFENQHRLFSLFKDLGSRNPRKGHVAEANGFE